VQTARIEGGPDGAGDDLHGWWLSPSYAQATNAEDVASATRDASTPAFIQILPQEPWDTKWRVSCLVLPRGSSGAD
jgi:hypothetical protein